MAVINGLVVHEVKWAERFEKKTAKVKHRQDENEIDELSQTVVKQLTELFNGTSLSSGRFHSEEQPDEGDPVPVPSAFELLLSERFAGEFKDFLEFSKNATDIFAGQHFEKAKSAKDGYLLFYHYTHSGDAYLAIVMLHRTTGMTLDERLAFQEVERLDLDTLHLAARINLTQWQDAAKLAPRYIKFRLGRNTGEMRRFFADFIGCLEYIADKEDTLSVINAIADTCGALGKTQVQKESINAQAEAFCKERKNEDGQISLEELGNHLFPEDPKRLVEIAQKEPYYLNDFIGIDNRSLRRLQRYHGKTKQLAISFAKDQLGKSVTFNRDDDSLTLTQLPPDLIAELRRDTTDEQE